MPKSIPSKPANDPVVKQIEEFSASFATAINARNFDSKTSPWNKVMPSFRAEPILAAQEALDIHGLLDLWRRVFSEHPDAHVEAVDRYTRTLDEGRLAENYEILRFHNAPPGVVKQVIGRCTWLLRDGEWRMTSYKSMEGMNPAGIW